ncbi:hypothetical protein ACHQM5_000477 [Ranunculus cassubicifolius]
MRAPTALLTAKNIIKANPVKGTWGTKIISPQKKQGSDAVSGGVVPIATSETGTFVAFSKPPPVPPVLGPFLVLLLEMFGSNDKNRK